MRKLLVLLIALGAVVAANILIFSSGSKTLNDSTNVQPTKVVKLFFYNQKADAQASCEAEFVQPIERQVSLNATPEDVVRMLLSTKLSQAEKDQGFGGEFAGSGIKLTSSEMKNGKFSLQFEDPNNFGSGGSCRVGIMRAQIEKTAAQFEGVADVDILPETAFQP